MSDPVSSLQVIIGADAQQLIAELGAVDKSLARQGDKFDAAAKAASAFGAAAAGVGLALGAMVKAAAENADSLGKMAQSAGLAVEQFSELVYVAKLSDVSAEQLGTSIARLNRNIADTAAGTGEAREAFAALGIQVKNADGTLKNADDIMSEVAEQFAAMQDGAGKTALAMELFGKSGAAMIPMLNAGSSGIRQMREEARALGVTMDTETAKAAEQFNDQLTRVQQAGQGLSNQLMRELLPAMNQVADAMVSAAKQGGGLESSMTGLADKMKSGALVVFQTLAVLGSDVAFVFKGIGTEVGGIAAQLASLATGNFKAFSDIGRMMKEDARIAREELDAFQARIMNTHVPGAPDSIDNWDRMGRAGGGRSAYTGGGRGESKSGDRSGKESTWLGQQLQEGMDEEMRIMAEIADIMTKYRQREREEEQAQYDARNKALIEFYDRQQEEAIRAGEEYLAIEKAKMTEIQRFEQKSMKDRVKTVGGELANLTAGVAQHSRTMFNINKAAGIANAIINAYEGISLTMAKYPYPINVALAAAHGAAAFAQVAAIRSAQFQGGGGAAPSIAGSTAAPAVSPVSSGTPGASGGNALDRTVTIVGLDEGALFSGGRVRGLIEAINEEVRNGARIRVAS